jgi:PAS fold
LVAAPDLRGDSYLCVECFKSYLDGQPLPYVRHSPSIRSRPYKAPFLRKSPGKRKSVGPSARPKDDDPTLLQALSGFAHESVVLIDTKGAIQAVVGPVGGVLGHNERAGILQYVHPEDLSFAYAQLAQIEAPGSWVEFQIRGKHADGSYRMLEIQAFNRLNDPTLEGLVIVSRLAE